MNNYTCQDCNAAFEIAKPKHVPDATGQDGIFIDVCPNCLSDHIEPLKQLEPQQINKLLSQWCETFIQKCMDNKTATNDPILLTHYTTMIGDSQNLLKQLVK